MIGNHWKLFNYFVYLLFSFKANFAFYDKEYQLHFEYAK